MAQIELNPDMKYMRELMEAGGENMKKCFQCGACAVACPVSPASHPFPRKEMIWASFGQKKRLMSDPDLWICQNCGNCSDLCPRGAQPAQLMSAARNMVFQSIVLPGPWARWMSRPSGLVWLISIPMAIWLIVWAIRAAIVGAWFPRETGGKIVFSQIFSEPFTIDPIFMITFFGALWILCVGSARLWRRFTPEGETRIIGKKKGWLTALWYVLWNQVGSAQDFQKCEYGPKTGVKYQGRRVSHTLMVWSFCILAFVTSTLAVGYWGGRLWAPILIVTPMPLNYWLKIIANIGALMILVALIMLTWRRLTLPRRYQSSTYYDWYLLDIIWAVALTGIFSQIFRLADWIHCAYISYYLHLVSIWMLFAYVPWSKLGHFVYRTVAKVHVEMYGRK